MSFYGLIHPPFLGVYQRGPNKGQPVEHGTQWAYQRYKCRCERCRDGNSVRQLAWRERRRMAGTHRLLKGRWVPV